MEIIKIVCDSLRIVKIKKAKFINFRSNRPNQLANYEYAMISYEASRGRLFFVRLIKTHTNAVTRTLDLIQNGGLNICNCLRRHTDKIIIITIYL